MFASIKVLSFDLDDTLWDVGRVIERAELQLGRWMDQHYPRIPGAFDAERIGLIRREIAAASPQRTHDFRYIRGMMYRRMARETGYPDTFADAALEEFDRWRNVVDLYADAMPALERLRARFRLIALTNGSADVERIGLGRYFETTVNAVAAGSPKPHAPIFAAAADYTGVDTASILHVGDDPLLDVDGARRAGLRTAWVNRAAAVWPTDLPPPDLEVSHLGDLAAALEAQSAGR